MEIRVLHMTRAVSSIPEKLEGMGCISGQKGRLYSCFPGFVKVCCAVTFTQRSWIVTERGGE